MNLGVQTVRRTANVATHHGVSAGITEFGRAMSWYYRFTKPFYRDKVILQIPWNTFQEVVVQAVAMIL